MGTQKFGTHLEHLWAVSGSRSGRLIAVAGERGSDGMGRGSDGELVDRSKVHVYVKAKLESLASFDVEGSIWALDFAADDLLIAGGSRGELHGFDLASETPSKLFTSKHAVGVEITAIGSDEPGKRIAVVDDSGHLAVYAVERSGLTEKYRDRLSARPLRTAAFDASSGKLAVGGDDGVVRVLAFDSNGALVGEAHELATGEKGIFSLTFTGDGRVIAGCGDGSIRVSYLEGAADEEDRSGDQAHVGPVTGLVLGLQLHDEAGRELTRRLLSIGEDGKLKAWIHDTRRQPKTIELGSNLKLRAMSWLRPYRAKDDNKGGTLLIVDAKRRLHLVKLDAEGSPNEDIDHIASHFAKLGEDLDARKDELRIQAVNELASLPEDTARTLLDRVMGRDGKPELRKLACEAVAKGQRRAVARRFGLRWMMTTRPCAGLRLRPCVRSKASARSRRSAPRCVRSTPTFASTRSTSYQRCARSRRWSQAWSPSGCATGPITVVRAAALAKRCASDRAEVGSRAPLRTAFEQGPPDIRIAALRSASTCCGADQGRGRRRSDRSRPARGRARRRGRRGARDGVLARRSGADPRLLGEARGQASRPSSARLAKLGGHARARAAVSIERGGARAALRRDGLAREADTALRGAKSLAVLGDARAVGALLAAVARAGRSACAGRCRRRAVRRDPRDAGRRSAGGAACSGCSTTPTATVRAGGVRERCRLLASDRADAGALGSGRARARGRERGHARAGAADPGGVRRQGEAQRATRTLAEPGRLACSATRSTTRRPEGPQAKRSGPCGRGTARRPQTPADPRRSTRATRTSGSRWSRSSIACRRQPGPTRC
jgi:ParB family chromosome partitioning protein